VKFADRSNSSDYAKYSAFPQPIQPDRALTLLRGNPRGKDFNVRQGSLQGIGILILIVCVSTLSSSGCCPCCYQCCSPNRANCCSNNCGANYRTNCCQSPTVDIRLVQKQQQQQRPTDAAKPLSSQQAAGQTAKPPAEKKRSVPPAQEVQQVSYRHSELHPLPTRPAFMPRPYANTIIGAPPVASTGSIEPALQIEIETPSAPKVLTSPSGKTGSAEPKDRLTMANSDQASGAAPWIFPPEEMRRAPRSPDARPVPAVADRPTLIR